MPDAFTILPGQVTAKPSVADDGPAVAAPPVTVPGIDETIAKIKARLNGKAPAAKPTAEPAAGKPNDNPADADEGKGGNAKMIAELGRLQARVRELEPKTKELDSFKTDAELSREIKKLWNGTPDEKIKAIAMISGKDGTDEMLAMFKTLYTLEQDKPDDGSEAVPPAVKALSDKLEAALKKIEAMEAKEADKEKSGTKSVSDAAIEAANKHVAGFIEKNKAKFEICAREENQAEAVDLIQSAAIAFIDQELGKDFDVSKLTQEQADYFYLKAADKTEKAFEETGKRLAKGSRPEKDLSRFDRFVRTPAKPTIVVKDEPLSKNPDEAFEQLKARKRAKLEAGDYARR